MVPEWELRAEEMSWAEQDRFAERTMVERVFSRLKDQFGARLIRVRGARKIMAHLRFGVFALTVDQLETHWLNYPRSPDSNACSTEHLSRGVLVFCWPLPPSSSPSRPSHTHTKNPLCQGLLARVLQVGDNFQNKKIFPGISSLGLFRQAGLLRAVLSLDQANA
jgi:hypothetical protein